MKNIFYLLLICAISLASCRKEIQDIETIVEQEEPIVLVESSIRGRIVNETGEPLNNVLVKVANETQTTNAQGIFNFKNIKVKKSGAIIEAKTNGYFSGIGRVNVSAEGSFFTEISMPKKGTPQVIDANVGDNFTSADGLNISIPPNALETLNGTIYDGSVNVYAKWIDPTGANMAGIMPGELTATDAEGNPQALISYGMVAFALETESGEELSLKEESKIRVEMPIPADLAADAPDEIDLWTYDLEEGQWLLAGACVKEANYYVCNIFATGYWNCDIGVPAICLSGRVLNNDLSPSSYLKVVIEDLTDNFIYWGYTDSLGFFCGSVPQAALLQISLVDHCDNIVYTEEIGPFATDFTLEDIILDIVVEEFLINITGAVGHCLSNDVPDGHLAVIYPGNIHIVPFTAGGIDTNLGLKCVAFPDLDIRFYSAYQAQATPPFIHNSFTDVDLGLQNTCEDLEDYFNLTVDGVDYWTSPTQFYPKENETTNWIIIEGLSGGGKFKLDLREFSGVGIYTTNTFLTTENEVFVPQYPVLSTSSPNITVEITAESEEFIEGSLTGSIDDGMGATVVIAGDFKVKKAP